MSEDFGQRACEQRHYEVEPSDLPLSCPTVDMRVWDAHPRVYLSMTTGQARCPYCSAQFAINPK